MMMKIYAIAFLLILIMPPGFTQELKTATFAGGCFWCMEEAFEKVKGVTSVVSGFHGGREKNPTYKQVAAGNTGHFESVEVVYDSEVVSYKKLLEVFWTNIDPVNADGQFCDEGTQYRSGIFYHNDEQKRLIDASVKELKAIKPLLQPIATVVEPATTFYPAKPALQDYYKRHPWVYKFYKSTCKREKRLKAIWN